MALYSFDQTYYLNNNPDVVTAIALGQFASAEQHYTMFGEAEGRKPNAQFDPIYYYAQNPDVLNAGMSALEHFEMFGLAEGRSPSAGLVFDEAYYLANNADVAQAVADGAFVSGWDHYVAYGADEGRVPSEGSDGGFTGTTYTLTLGVDIIPGTAGNDLIIAGAGSAAGDHTLGTADVINGAAGIDTIRITSVDNYLVPNMTSVENVSIQALGGFGDLDLINATGVQQITSNNSSGDLWVGNVAALASLQVNGGTGEDVGLEYAAGVLSGSSDVQSIGLNNANIDELWVDGNGPTDAVETLAIDATGTNFIETLWTESQTKTVTFAGAGNVTIDDNVNNVTTFDGAAATGNLNFGSDLDKLSVTTGSGNDTVHLQFAGSYDKSTAVNLGDGNDMVHFSDDVTGLNAGAVVDGGDGTDTLRINQDGGAEFNSVAAAARNFEILSLMDEGDGVDGVLDMTKLAVNNDISIVSLDDGAGGGLDGTTTILNAEKGVALRYTGGDADDGYVVTFVVKDAGAGSPDDVLNVSYESKVDNANSGTLLVSDVETINIKSIDTDTADAVKVNHSQDSLVVDQALKVTVDASSAGFTIGDLVADSLVLFDASSSVKAVSVTTADVFSSTKGVEFKLGAGADTIDVSAAVTSEAVAGDLNFRITGGSDADAIRLNGADPARDVLVYSALADSTATKFDNVTGFNATAGAVVTDDQISLTAFGFGAAAWSVVTKTAGITIDPAAGVVVDPSAAAGFFIDAGTARAVAEYESAGSTYVFVDANKDGNFSADADLVIQLTGVTAAGLEADNFIFG